MGPHRLHVHLARRLAAAGVPALRLDLGGIGDSTASTDAPTFRESAVADTRAAMTGLGELVDARRFVLFGVCAGADNALATALVDDRVAAVALIDPPTYPTRRAQLRLLRARIAELRAPGPIVRWGAALAERHARRLIARLRGDAEPAAQGREVPPPETFRAHLAALLARGVHVLAVYSGGNGVEYNHEDQLFERFPELRGRVERAFFPRANHTFTELAAQSELIAAVTRWIQSRVL